MTAKLLCLFITILLVLLGPVRLLAVTPTLPMMVSPGNDSFFEVRAQSRFMFFKINRPNKNLKYKLEIILNGREMVNHVTHKDIFKIKVGRYDHEVKWRVQGFDKEGNVKTPHEFWTVKIFQNVRDRKIDLNVDRHSLETKLIITWKEQEECSGYDVVYNENVLKRTKKNGITLNEHAEQSTVKIVCDEDPSHFGIVELMPKKILNNSFFYQFELVSMSLKQDLDNPAILKNNSEQSYLMQVHSLAHQLHWDLRKRNDIQTFLKFGKPINFSDDVQEISLEIRGRLNLFENMRERLLLEYETIRLDYEFADDVEVDQSISFLGAGLETYFNIYNKILKGAFLYRKEMGSSSLSSSFKLRFALPYSRKITWNSEITFNKFDGELDTGVLTGDTENQFTQFKLGFSYLF